MSKVKKPADELIEIRRPVTKYFFGDESFSGREVIIEKKKVKKDRNGSGTQKQKATVVNDISGKIEMIVVKYRTGYRESFTKSDIISGLVKIHT